MIKDLRYDDNSNIKAKTYAEAISRIKARISVVKDYENFFNNRLLNVMELYNEELRNQNLVDFDDLIYVQEIQ